MNIVLVNTFEGIGGAGIAALRLHRYYNSTGIDSRFLCWRTLSLDPSVSRIVKNPALWFLDTAIGRIVDKTGLSYLGYLSSSLIHRQQSVVSASIIHLHNLHGGYCSLRGMRKLVGKKIVWTLHDMWAFTGNCTHSKECERWLSGCGNCPHLDDYPKLRFDTTSFLWKYKERIYADLSVSIVCPSRWLYNKAIKSPLFKNFQIHCIPNGIDVQVFSPRSKMETRRKLGLDDAGLFTIFVSNSLEDSRKGTSEFVTILRNLESDRVDLTVILVGKGDFDPPPGFTHVKFVHIGEITNEDRMVDAYSAADFISFTSKAENLPNVLIESMACGTPAVSFKVGGVPEIIDHERNGFVVENRDCDDFCQRVKQLGRDPEVLRQLSEQAVKKVRTTFTIQMMADRYLQLYSSG